MSAQFGRMRSHGTSRMVRGGSCFARKRPATPCFCRFPKVSKWFWTPSHCRGTPRQIAPTLLERPELAPGHGGDRGTDAVSRLQEIGGEGRPRASISAYTGDAVVGAGRHLRADTLGNSPDVVRKHYAKWSRGRQANIDRLMLAHFDTATTSPVTKMSHKKTGAVN